MAGPRFPPDGRGRLEGPPRRFTRKQLEAIRRGKIVGIRAGTAPHRVKYDTPGSLKYVRDLRRPRSRDTTTQLVPL